MAESFAVPRPTTWASAPNRRLIVGSQTLVYRDLGPEVDRELGPGVDRELGPGEGVPLILLAHLGATLDEWDPRFVDAMATDRRVIAVDLPGVGGSTGRVPGTVAAMARAVEGFVTTLGLAEIDLLGFSLGGFIAQQVVLDTPHLIRRLVLAGTGPAGGTGIDHLAGGAYVYWDMARAALARTDAKEFLFFPRTSSGKAAAKAYLGRLRERVMDRDAPIALSSFHRQISAIQAWGQALPQDLSQIRVPTLIANGSHDRMVPTALSHDMHARLPDSTLIVYPNSGHGGVFHHGEEFARAVQSHLGAGH